MNASFLCKKKSNNIGLFWTKLKIAKNQLHSPILTATACYIFFIISFNFTNEDKIEKGKGNLKHLNFLDSGD